MKDEPQRPAEGPVILDRRATRVSPWITLVAKDVRFEPTAPPETYHCLEQADYVAVLAQTVTGRIPIVRQFRPAVEAFTWELPSGLLDPGETPEECCRRELLEETGMRVEDLTPLGSFLPDTGRLANRLHAFAARASEPSPGFEPEAGLELRLVSVAELRGLIRSGEFRHQLHLGVLLAASLGHFRLEIPRP